VGEVEFLPYRLLILGAVAVLFVAVLWGLRKSMIGRSRAVATIAGTVVLGIVVAGSNSAGIPASAVVNSLPLLAGLSFWVVNEDMFEPGVLLHTFAVVLAVVGTEVLLFGHSLHAIAAIAASGALIYLAERISRSA
jgi:hypothetical protein